MSLPASTTPTAHAPALRASSTSVRVSPSRTTAAGGNTRVASIARYTSHGSGGPARTSSRHRATSGSKSCSPAAENAAAAASRV